MPAAPPPPPAQQEAPQQAPQEAPPEEDPEPEPEPPTQTVGTQTYSHYFNEAFEQRPVQVNLSVDLTESRIQRWKAEAASAFDRGYHRGHVDGRVEVYDEWRKCDESDEN